MGLIPYLISYFRELILYLGLYIKKDFFSSIPVLLGVSILLKIFRMPLAILLQIAGVLAKPFFHPGVIVLAAVRIFPPPAGIVLSLECFFAEGISASLLSPADSGMGAKGFLAIRTL
jgi:hypothetical protein